jgi:serine/threonine protein phosphatase PrpC
MFDIIKNTDIEEPAKLLLDMANNAGGKDNITVVTVEG